MTPIEINANKQRFIDCCHQYIQRDGLDKILAYLEKSDFYEAPSTASYHLNEKGGLCKHSLNVFHTALKLRKHILEESIASGESPFTEVPSEESVAISALFHDICKVKLYHQTEKWKKDGNGRWMSYPGYELKDDFPLGHGEKSCLMLSWYIRMKPEEMLAIRWHMGMFDMGENGSSMRYAFRAASEKTPLVMLLHAADFLSANLMEKTTTY